MLFGVIFDSKLGEIHLNTQIFSVASLADTLSMLNRFTRNQQKQRKTQCKMRPASQAARERKRFLEEVFWGDFESLKGWHTELRDNELTGARDPSSAPVKQTIYKNTTRTHTTHTYIPTDRHTYTHRHTYAHTHTHTHTQTYTEHTHAHTDIHARTHTQNTHIHTVAGCLGFPRWAWLLVLLASAVSVVLFLVLAVRISRAREQNQVAELEGSLIVEREEWLDEPEEILY